MADTAWNAANMVQIAEIWFNNDSICDIDASYVKQRFRFIVILPLLQNISETRLGPSKIVID